MQLVYALGGMEHRIELREGTIVLGRSARCDIMLRDPSVSATHLQIECKGGAVTCRDLDSSNGSFVNDKQFSETTVRPGDALQLGKILLRVEESEPGTTPAPAPAAAVRGEDTETPPVLEPLGGVNQQPSGPETEQQAKGERREGGEGEYLPQVEVRPGAAVEVYAGAQEPTRRRGRRIVLVAGVLVAVLLLALLLFVPAQNEPQPAAAYGRTEYREDVRAGIEHFENRDFGKAVSAWAQAREQWEKNHPDQTSYAVVASRLALTFESLAEAQQKGSYASVNWTSILQETRMLLDEVSMPDDVEHFVKNVRTMASHASAAQRRLEEARESLAQGEYAQAQETLSEIREDSLYRSTATSLAEQARQSAYEEEKHALYALTRDSPVDWPRVVARAEELMRTHQDPDLAKDVAQWREYAEDYRTFQEAQTAQARGTIPALERAKALYGSLDEESIYYDRAQARVRELQTRILHERARALFQAGDTDGLRALAEDAPEAENDPVYVELLGKAEEIEEQFAAADEALAQNNPLEARSHWEQVRNIAQEWENAYNQRAVARLKEWSRERIGSSVMDKAQRAYEAEEYREARELLSEAAKLGVDVSQEREALRRQARHFFTEAQNAYNRQQIWGAREQAELAKQCLLPDDDLYAQIEKFLAKLDRGGGP